MSDKIRKYVLPNLPYLFVFWFFSKIGTAYRIAPGTDFGTKLMGMLDTFPEAFETYWPGLGGIDLLVGLTGAAGMYLLIQSKIRQAKKFRRDAEYGTARFGTKEDIKPFVDPKFQNNVILTGTEFLTMNTRPKIPANARNLNACVIGSSGSGKTRFWLTPQLLQAHSSYVVVDPKGGTLDQCGRFLQREKYRVRVFNSIDFSKSMHYNPLAYIKTESDVLKFVTALIANTKGDGKEGDEFWTKAETLLYCALVAYIVFEGPEEERNMNTLVEMINSMEVREDDETFKNAVDYMFDGLERSQLIMKEVNAYYRKHGKLDGCALLSPDQIEKLKASMAANWRSDPRPFESYQLTNNNAEIRRVKTRIEQLSKQAQREFSGWEFDGGRVEMNREDNRLQVFFDGKPDADTRAELKSSGFRWAPSVGAWQRQLTDNAIRAADRLECIKPLSGEKPSQLQKKPSILQTMREQGEKVQTEPEKKAPSGRDAER